MIAWGRSIETAKYHGLKVESASNASAALKMARDFLTKTKDENLIKVSLGATWKALAN